MKKAFFFTSVVVLCTLATISFAADIASSTYTNSLGMNFVRIEPGEFMMGHDSGEIPNEMIKDMAYPTKKYMQDKYPKSDPEGFMINLENLRFGDPDEQPWHKVTISNAFYMGVCEVTNSQYEEFDPNHRRLRGKEGFGNDDNEAVVFVSWEDAQAFCKWLSDKEGVPCRLPTEAEWEYSCRAGTETLFYTGDELPAEFCKYERRVLGFRNRGKEVKLTVRQTLPNGWGLFDMHGNVEEWCQDWYGPYSGKPETDPVGRIDGNYRVTRGGSHSTERYYLRSANRMGNIPVDRSMIVGFRVVIGKMPETKPLPRPGKQLYQQNVSQKRPKDIKMGPDEDLPYFKGPIQVVRMADSDRGPLFYYHNHFMSMTDCPNGDILAAWHSCVNEKGRELSVACSRLRYGSDEWEPASVFWDVPDRNDHGHSMFNDGNGTIYHFNGLPVTVRSVALIMRTSRDNGVSWTKPVFVSDEHCKKHRMPVEAVFRSREGHFIMVSDSGGGSGVWISEDRGKSWYKPGEDNDNGRIRGSHAGVVQLDNGKLFALGRGADFDGKMPASISSDMGQSWQYYPTGFPAISSGQRLVLLKLQQGPLLLVSFTKECAF